MSAADTHEDLTRKHKVRGPSDRNFGIVFTIFLFCVGLAPLRRHLPVRYWALTLSILLLLVALVRPNLLRPFNRRWMQLGHLLGRVTTPIVTALLFFLVFTPLGLLSRALGKDSLRLAYDENACSYWIERRPPGPKAEEMSNQF